MKSHFNTLKLKFRDIQTKKKNIMKNQESITQFQHKIIKNWTSLFPQFLHSFYSYYTF